MPKTDQKQRLLLTCDPISELPSNISNMIIKRYYNCFITQIPVVE